VSSVVKLRRSANPLFSRQPAQCPAGFASQPLYSHQLAEVGLETPWEQYGLYASSFFGLFWCGKQLFFAHNLQKYIATNDKTYLTVANVPYSEAHRARALVVGLRARGVAMVFAAPAAWLLWRASARYRSSSLR
jgi:hypothetical protein